MSKFGIFPTDEWMLADGTGDDGYVTIRYRTSKPSKADQKRFSTLIRVRWKFTLDILAKSPIASDQAKMDAFEDRIIAVSDKEKSWGSCVAVITASNIREWRFYAPDAEKFSDAFNRALEGYGPYPLEIGSYDDPQWKGLAELITATAAFPT